MNFTVENNKIGFEENLNNIKILLGKDFDITGLSQKALDYLWKKSWVKDSILSPEEHIFQVERKLGEMAGRYDYVILIAPKEVRILLEGILSMCFWDDGETKNNLIFFPETLSSIEYFHTFEKIRDNECGMLVIGSEEETLGQVTAYSCFKQAMSNKYGAENLKTRIQFVINEKSKYFGEEAANGEYVVHKLPNDVELSALAGTDAILIPLIISGVDIKAFYNGFREVLSSPSWDREGDEYACNLALWNCSYEGDFKLRYWQKEMEKISKAISEIFSGSGMKTNSFLFPENELQLDDKSVYLTQVILKNESKDIMLPAFPGASMEGSMNCMVKEHCKDMYEKYPGTLIQVEEMGPYECGKIIGFAQLSYGIASFVIKKIIETSNFSDNQSLHSKLLCYNLSNGKS